MFPINTELDEVSWILDPFENSIPDMLIRRQLTSGAGADMFDSSSTEIGDVSWLLNDPLRF